MLSSNLQSLLDNRLHYLPAITGQAIQSIDWSTELINIGRKYGLHIDEMEDLQTIVLKSLIGLLPAEEFENNLISNLALSPSNADKVMSDINDRIFSPIHEFVMNKGKKPDTLSATGIVLQPSEDATPSFGSMPTSPVSATLEIPASPSTRKEFPIPRPATAPAPTVQPQAPAAMPLAFEKPKSDKPFVQGKFDDFFVNIPTSTNQSLGK